MNTTRLQQQLIVDFVLTARDNGVRQLWAALPASHALVRTNKVGQIRKVKDALAQGFDELGNRIRLTPDLRVLQD